MVLIIYSFFEIGKGLLSQVPKTVVDNSNTITAEVTVKSGVPSKIRYWDIRVTNPDSSTGDLGKEFIIQP